MLQSQEMNSTRQYSSKLQIARGMACSTHNTIYSARLFIHRITSAQRTREVRPAVLVRKSSTQLSIYLLDTYVRYSTYLTFEVSERLHRGPEFSGNHLIDYNIHYTIITS